MSIYANELSEIYKNNEKYYAGRREDYFGVLYMKKKFDLTLSQAIKRIAFGDNDSGVDGYHIDTKKRNLYLYQFKWSRNHHLFKESFNHLNLNGLNNIFDHQYKDKGQNKLLLQLKSDLNENQSLISNVLITFVFNGDPALAEQSEVLDSLREDLESKKYIIDQYFEPKHIKLTFQYESNRIDLPGAVTIQKDTYRYIVKFKNSLNHKIPSGETLYIGSIRLMDLYRMSEQMGHRLLARNIRMGLSVDKPPNKAIRQALYNIVITMEELPEVFLFNHNGFTISAKELNVEDEKKDMAEIIEPRVLNGAQTITSLNRFLKDNHNNPILKINKVVLENIFVPLKVVISDSDDFLTNVTICNNRQNPVEPWHLRAHDPIQLELADMFKERMGIYYERQEKAFDYLTFEDLEDMGIEQPKAIQIKKLAQTFLAVQGEVKNISRLKDVFEKDRLYNKAFRETFVKSDPRKIVLIYKIQFRIKSIINSIISRGIHKYDYTKRARNLIWSLITQGLLNDGINLGYLKENYGTDLTLSVDYVEHLKMIATNQVRYILRDVIDENENYSECLESESYAFLKTKEFFRLCMRKAAEEYGWNKKLF